MLIIASPYFVILTITTVLAILVQISASYIIFMFSPKNMQSYKPLLMLYTIYEIIFTFVAGFLLQGSPTGSEENPDIMFTGLLVRLFRVKGAHLGMALFYASFGLVLFGQSMCILYRFLVFHTRRRAIFDFIFHRRKIRIINVIFYVLIAVIALFGSFTLSLSSHETQFNSTGVIFEYHTNTSSALIVCAVFLILWVFVYYRLTMRIMKLMRPKIGTFSPNTIRLHKQLTFILFAQACIPLIFFVIILVLSFLNTIFPNAHFGYKRIQAMFMIPPVQMMINSILILLFFEPFRLKLKRFILKSLVCLRIRADIGGQTVAPIMSISHTGTASPAI